MDSFDNQVTTPSIKEEHEAFIDALLVTNSLVFPMVVNAAIELDLFGIIAKAGPGARISASEIASQLPTHNPEAASMIDRMLHLFASHSLLACSMSTLENGRIQKLYALAPASKFLLQNNDEGCLSHLVTLGCHHFSLEVWRHMKDVILEGGNLFEKVHGISAYQFINNNQNLSNTFNQAMVGLSTMVMKGILDIYRGFDGLKSLVDVGGGTGKCMQMIISKYPSIKGINYDLPHVIQSASPHPGIKHLGGDMFEGVPSGDAIMIKDTCHNWNDESCLKLLKNCYKVLPEKGKLIIINVILPEEPQPSKASMYASTLDNIMLANLAGKERTTKEFETLCKRAGFSDFQVVCVAFHIWAIMESYK